MKKSNLYVGIGYVLAGLTCLAAVIFLPAPEGLRSILCGLGGGGVVPGLMMIGKYFYWSRPENAPRYQARLDAEAIEMKDELKEAVRNQAGCLAYRVGILVISLSLLVFAVLGGLGVLDNLVISLYLFGYLVFQLVIGGWLFKRLMKRY